MPVLRQPRDQQRAARPIFGGRSGTAHAGLLPAQLHRGPVPVQRHHPQPRLHHGAGGGGRARAARRPRLSRLHPPQDHPRRVGRTAGARGPLRRPAEHQHRAAHRRRPGRAGARERRRCHQAVDGAAVAAHCRRARPGPRSCRCVRAGPGLAHGVAAACASAPGRCTALCARRAEHADDRGRRRGRRPGHPGHQRAAVRCLWPQAGVLLGFQPHSRCIVVAAFDRAAAGARAPAVPGRLAHALLWLCARRDRGRCRHRHAGAGRRPQAGLGAGTSRPLSCRPEPRTTRAAAARARPGCYCRHAAAAGQACAPAACGRPAAPACAGGACAAVCAGGRPPATRAGRARCRPGQHPDAGAGNHARIIVFEPAAPAYRGAGR